MPISVTHQVYVFLWSIAGGMLIAFLYDLFRIKRKTIKTHILMIYLEDLIFWILVAVILFLTVYLSNDGEIRGFIFLGTAIGIILYALTLSRLVMGLALLILRGICRALLFLWQVITYPFKLLFRILSIPGRGILRMIRWVGRGLRRFGRARSMQVRSWKRALRNIRKKV